MREHSDNGNMKRRRTFIIVTIIVLLLVVTAGLYDKFDSSQEYKYSGRVENTNSASAVPDATVTDDTEETTAPITSPEKTQKAAPTTAPTKTPKAAPTTAPTKTPKAAPTTAPTKTPKPTEKPNSEGSLDVYFIDVGQGDSILLVSDSGKTMLVDVGEYYNFTKVSILLDSLDIDKLDAVVATHPHSDHIGGMADLIENYEIDEFYMPECENDTKTYENMMNALDEYNVHVNYVYGGTNSYINWDKNTTVSVLSPILGGEYDGINNYSIMLHVECGGTKLLLEGDCEMQAESYVLAKFPVSRIDADILKVGHHGSYTATSDAFLNAVSPSLAVISLGYNNRYGHPHDETLTKLERINATIMRTDQDGTIHVVMENGTYKVM